MWKTGCNLETDAAFAKPRRTGYCMIASGTGLPALCYISSAEVHTTGSDDVAMMSTKKLSGGRRGMRLPVSVGDCVAVTARNGLQCN